VHKKTKKKKLITKTKERQPKKPILLNKNERQLSKVEEEKEVPKKTAPKSRPANKKYNKQTKQQDIQIIPTKAATAAVK